MQDIISPPPGLDIPPPVPITKYYTRRERIGCSWVNFFAISAIYRIFFILFAIGGLIAAIMAQQGNDAYNRYPGYASLRIAYIIFVIIALLVQIAIFTLDVINAFAVRPLNRLPVNLIILAIDGVLFISILVISVFCISKANALSTDSYGPNSFGYYFYNASAFYAAGIFGYMMSLLFLEEIIYLGLQILARRMACSCWYFCR